MNNDEKKVKELWKKLVKFYKKNTYLFPDKDGSIRQQNNLLKKIKQILANERNVTWVLDVFLTFSKWKLYYTHYSLVEKENEEQALKNFSQSTASAYLSIKNTSLTYECFNYRFFELMDTVSLPMAQAFISGWKKEAFEIAEVMIASINHGKIKNYEEQRSIEELIGCGLSLVPASWFMLELYCKLEGRDFNRKNANYPTRMIPYDNVLDNWDTEDMIKVEKYIHMLCTMHLDQAKEQVTDEDYFEFGNSSRYLFPYEILTWLKLRELKGLKNPKTFTHPLMNTPIAKMFLNIKEPLPKPKELPYAKELLEKLKEQCPDVEIPEWLDGSSSDSTTDENTEEMKEEKHNKDNIIPDDFFVKE